MRRTVLTLTLLVAALWPVLPAHAAASGCALPRFGPGADYQPVFRVGAHPARVTNPWFPLPPGRTWIYAGVQDGHRAVDVVSPSRRTRVIDGVRTRVVHDRLLIGGRLRETTEDYYAQDRCGNVWYFGEDTAELDRHGRVVTREGSFHAGVDGAQPGVYMQAHPQLRRVFRQEWYAGHAEDRFKVVSKHAAVRVPYRSFSGALRTRERTALEPGIVDGKVFVRGVGEVSERTVRGPREFFRLVSVLR